VEKKHIIRAFCFELGKVETTGIRVRMVGILNQIDTDLAAKVAEGLRLEVPASPEQPMNYGVSPDSDGEQEPKSIPSSVEVSQALSMINNPTVRPTIASRKVAIVCADGVSEKAVLNMKSALIRESAKGFVVAPYQGKVRTDQGGEMPVDFSFLTSSSVLFDAVYIPGGLDMNELSQDPDVMDFLSDAYRHCKVIGAQGEGVELLSGASFASKLDNTDEGIVLDENIESVDFIANFIAAMANHRFWLREAKL
jgi:catalase